MLIRHDLELVFLHVPKCAGKELRRVLSHGSPEGCLESLFNYSFSAELGRYIDLAHLPLADLRHRPEFAWLSCYTVVACVRNPYSRLRSAASEYYRQLSAATEQRANSGQLSRHQRWAYYRQLPTRHSQQDPRFIHSQPIHRFTHLGEEPMVDHLLRCETLLSDILALAERKQWPSSLVDEAKRSLHDAGHEALKLDPEERSLANQLHHVDFQLFGYTRDSAPATDPLAWPQEWPDVQEQLQPRSSLASELDLIHYAPTVQWHWGPTAQQRPFTQHRATRSDG
jgi:hypothetical protein